MNKAVHTYCGVSKLFMHRRYAESPLRWSICSSILEYKENVDPSNFVEVEVIDLVEFIAKLGARVRLMKMDIEGVECPIVNKLIDSGVIHSIDRLLVEVHDQKNPSLREETARLRQRITDARLQHISLDWI